MKYSSIVAKVFDGQDWDSAETGDVEWFAHIRAFYNIDMDAALDIISDYVDSGDIDRSFSIRKIIDLLIEGRNWLVLTDSQGFVNAVSLSDLEEAKAEFERMELAYEKWANFNAAFISEGQPQPPQPWASDTDRDVK
jgi:hypothetical protein